MQKAHKFREMLSAAIDVQDNSHELDRSMRESLNAQVTYARLDEQLTSAQIEEIRSSAKSFRTAERLLATWNGAGPIIDAWTRDPDSAKRIAVGTLRSRLFAAYTVPVEDEYLIIVDDAFHDIVYQRIKLFFACINVTYSDDQADDDALGAPPRFDLDHAARVDRWALSHLRFFDSLWQPIGVLLDSEQFQFGLTIIEYAQLFVLLHEFSHINAGHLERDLLEAHIGGVSVEHGVTQNEFVADLMAVMMLLNPTHSVSPKYDPGEDALKIVGARLALSAIASIEGVYLLSPSRSHPPASKRFALIVEGLQQAGIPVEPFVEMDKLLSDYEKRVERSAQISSPLSDLVESSKRLRWNRQYTVEESGIIDEVERLDRSVSLPMAVRLQTITRGIYGYQVDMAIPSLLLRVVARELADQLERIPVEKHNEFVRGMVLACAGEAWIFEVFLESIDSIEGRLAFLSPEPGTTFSELCSQLRGTQEVPADQIFRLATCLVEYGRRLSTSPPVPVSHACKSVVAAWMEELVPVWRSVEGDSSG